MTRTTKQTTLCTCWCNRTPHQFSEQTCANETHPDRVPAPQPATEGDSCGRHYPAPCGPDFCKYRGDRFSKRQIDGCDYDNC